MSSAAIQLLLEGCQCHSRWVADVIKYLLYAEDQLLMRLCAKSGFWVVDWWRGVGCTMWNKARKLRKELLSTSSLGNCFVIDYTSREGRGKFHARKRELAFEVCETNASLCDA